MRADAILLTRSDAVRAEELAQIEERIRGDRSACPRVPHGA
jgi:G3E family GTPase